MRRRQSRPSPRLRFLGILLAFLGGPLLGQTNEEVFREFQFDFSVPGARAMGMGGAFIGTADDATASFANPAGLAYLTDPGFTFEYRRLSEEGDEGSLPIGGETNSNIVFTEDPLSTGLWNFASANYRWRGWFFGVYHHVYLREKQRRFFDTRVLQGNFQRVESREVRLDFRGRTLGLGVARRLGPLKLGATFNYVRLAGETEYFRNGFIRSLGNGGVRTLAYQSTIDDRDAGLGFNLGLLHEVNPNFTWGMVWRENPKLTLTESVLETVNEQPVLIEHFEVPFVVPDVFGTGLQWRARPNLRFMLDWQRIFYSEMIGDDFVIAESIQTEEAANYVVRDIDQIHAGLEWLLAGERQVWAIRTGYFRNPPHTVSYVGDDPFIAERFTRTRPADEDHVTVGLGWVLDNRFEVDAAANFRQDGREVTLSVIWRMK
ncbi:Outer membrane protein transport protein [Sulfidibacter corallicola]|uniref:Outer membrane protein transport protein n=1 Tax=Sulfidibacter corallicola TaxID=2818388 RepID=A0A8A4TK83_SULCO|nr:outer membrane protein transport protein [Sulfidibacter corallicola]QTD49950.1 outer membrane protein transport protein [Sulfidibacter corallicola]